MIAPRVRRSLALLLVAATIGAGRGAHAQTSTAAGAGAQLDIVIQSGSVASTEVRAVVGTNMLSDSKTRELLRNGFPTRLHYRAELWRESGWFDDREAVTEWDVLVSYDPATGQYRAVRQRGNLVEDFGGFATLSSVQERLNLPFPLPIRPRRQGQSYYYNVVLDITTLDVSDLDELQRWLRGELTPAVRGRTNPANALARGMGTLVSRLLGGERRHYEHRSTTFRAP